MSRETTPAATWWRMSTALAIVILGAGVLVAYRLGETIAWATERWGYVTTGEPDFFNAESPAEVLVLLGWIGLYAACMFAGSVVLRGGSTGSESGDQDWYVEGCALAGKDFIGRSWGVSPYAGVGLRHLSNGVAGVPGYRTDDYLYLPVGVTTRTQVASGALSAVSSGLESCRVPVWVLRCSRGRSTRSGPPAAS